MSIENGGNLNETKEYGASQIQVLEGLEAVKVKRLGNVYRIYWT